MARNTLNSEQRYKLTKFIEYNLDSLSGKTVKQIIEACHDKLGSELNLQRSHIVAVAKFLPLKFSRGKTNPGASKSFHTKKLYELEKSCKILASAVRELYMEIDAKIPHGVQKIIDSYLAKYN